MKDLFSAYADQYAQFRPVYPPVLYDFLLERVKDRQCAWDVGTGNGQVATVLAKHFDRVIASDISQQQLDQAPRLENISYRCEPAEKTSIPDRSLSLITGAQAPHWFNFNQFYAEVNRVAAPGALIALWCYSLLEIHPELDAIIRKIYFEVLGHRYWDPARKLIDEGYQTIPFPFKELPAPDIYIKVSWSLPQLMGYLTTWSAVQHYISKNNKNPLEEFFPLIEAAWGETAIQTVCFPLHFRIGRIE